MVWISKIYWPPEVRIGNEGNFSEDTHQTEGQAKAVCRGVQREGLGGEGKIFPVKVEWFKMGE
jgi:beta-glucosidase-like glycosyl hydrolase